MLHIFFFVLSDDLISDFNEISTGHICERRCDTIVSLCAEQHQSQTHKRFRLEQFGFVNRKKETNRMSNRCSAHKAKNKSTQISLTPCEPKKCELEFVGRAWTTEMEFTLNAFKWD